MLTGVAHRLAARRCCNYGLPWCGTRSCACYRQRQHSQTAHAPSRAALVGAAAIRRGRAPCFRLPAQCLRLPWRCSRRAWWTGAASCRRVRVRAAAHLVRALGAASTQPRTPLTRRMLQQTTVVVVQPGVQPLGGQAVVPGGVAGGQAVVPGGIGEQNPGGDCRTLSIGPDVCRARRAVRAASSRVRHRLTVCRDAARSRSAAAAARFRSASRSACSPSTAVRCCVPASACRAACADINLHLPTQSTAFAPTAARRCSAAATSASPSSSPAERQLL